MIDLMSYSPHSFANVRTAHDFLRVRVCSEKTITGNSVPFKGHKGSYQRGGVSATAILHSPLIAEEYRGTTYTGTMHITDWLPTLMNRATDGEWTGSYSGADIDGVDLWDAITTGDSSTQHEEIVFYADSDSAVIQSGDYKYFYNTNDQAYDEPAYVFESDKHPEDAHFACENPTLLDYSSSGSSSKSKKDDKSGKSDSDSRDSDSEQVGGRGSSSSASSGSVKDAFPGPKLSAPIAVVPGGLEAGDAEGEGEGEGGNTPSDQEGSEPARGSVRGYLVLPPGLLEEEGGSTKNVSIFGLSKMTMMVVVLSIVGALMLVHVWARKYLGRDEGGFRSGLMQLGPEASRGYVPLKR
jgi:hypothetical protein